VSLHGALTPTWSETAWWADYVLPMGHGPEWHDTQSYETLAGRWLGFRQPVQRVTIERMGREVQFTYEANPGEVWEEASSGSSSRGAPIATARAGSVSTTSPLTGPATRSRSRSTTAGCSRTRPQACPRRPPPKA
jgi:hypothetical protein